LTGGPGVGKTTLMKACAARGYQTVPEAYAVLYEQATCSNNLATFFNDPVALYARILEKQIAFESVLDEKAIAFLDRSAVDILAFAQFFNVSLSADICEHINSRHYDGIFFLDPLPIHLYKQCAQRKETYDQALEIHALLKEVYRQCGYAQKIIHVPFGAVDERIAYILNHLET
jgi:predicted ATPase